MDFLAESNLPGQQLLRLVSRGNAIIAEMLRLSKHVPAPFLQRTDADRKWEDILIDFSYFDRSDWFESKIDSNPALMDLDVEFRDGHIEILTRFYLLFESMWKYLTDFKRYLADLEEGVFIQLTLDTVLMNVDGKQLLSEAVFLLGIMLLLVDIHIPGPVRERMMICYYRYKGPSEVRSLDDVKSLLSTTGYAHGASRQPPNYPESFFARADVSGATVNMIIARLRMDDVYSQISAWPIPEHRSTALATQAAMLYVILYFVPNVLNGEASVMREVVDKHFADNWIISVYLGHTVDLTVEWSRYRAARVALENTHAPANVQRLCTMYTKKMPKLIGDVNHFLTEGVLSEEFLLDNTHKVLTCLRHCNDCIRWLMLHSTTQHKKLSAMFRQAFSQPALLELLLKTAQFEFVLRALFTKLLEEKEPRWQACRDDAAQRMQELSDYYSGDLKLARVQPNENLRAWFSNLSEQVTQIDFTDSTLAGRKIQQLIQALTEVEQFQEIDASLQVKEFLKETRGKLVQMIRIVNILEEHLVNISIVSDMSYSWQIINTYVPLMQEHIKRRPKSTLLLRSTFLKLSSIMDLTLLRIVQAQSRDLFSVSEYYSGQLVAFVRRVLEIVPRSMFLQLRQIIDLQTNRLRELPPKVEKANIRAVAQFAERHQLAEMTHRIAQFTDGILAMETTLVGIIQVDPKKLLEDGIRKELVRHVAKVMDSTLVFTDRRSKIEAFEARLRSLAQQLAGFRRSFSFISDYANVYGLKIWQEEFSRIVNYNVEQECASFLKRKIYDWQSMYQSVAIPIPSFPPVDRSVNFIGRLTRELILHTSVEHTLYLDTMGAWYDGSGRELVGLRTFTLLQQSVGVFGLTGVDRLLCFMMVQMLQRFNRELQTALVQHKPTGQLLVEVAQELHPTPNIPTAAAKLYQRATTKLSRLWPLFHALVTKLGQGQLLRKQIANALNFTCKLDSNILACSMQALNLGLINDVQQHYAAPDEKPYPSRDNPLLPELTDYLETAGINDPLTKIYIAAESPTEHLAVLTFVFVLHSVEKFRWNATLSIMQHQGSRKEQFDFTPLVAGIISLLKQFHSQQTQQFLAFLGQYVRAMLNLGPSDTKKRKKALPPTYPDAVTSVLLFLEAWCKLSSMKRKAVEKYVPSYVFDHFGRIHGKKR